MKHINKINICDLELQKIGGFHGKIAGFQKVGSWGVEHFIDPFVPFTSMEESRI